MFSFPFQKTHPRFCYASLIFRKARVFIQGEFFCRNSLFAPAAASSLAACISFHIPSVPSFPCYVSASVLDTRCLTVGTVWIGRPLASDHAATFGYFSERQLRPAATRGLLLRLYFTSVLAIANCAVASGYTRYPYSVFATVN